MDSPIDPALFERDDLRPALTGHDIGALYRALRDAGISQRQIAQRIGQTQSEVSEILKGTRQVDNYRVLERIAEGLGIPRERMGLSYGPDDPYPGEVTVAELEEAEAMFRRHLLALGGRALTGATVAKLGALLADLPWPGPTPLPRQLSGVHVTQVRDLTRGLQKSALTVGSTPEVSSAAAAWAMRLLAVPGVEPVRRALMSALAELHIHAGWAGFDAGHYGRSGYHYSRALELANDAGDAYCQTLALNWAGLATVEHGHPNDGLKILQCAQAKTWEIPQDTGGTVVIGEGSRTALEACGLGDSAIALAALGLPEAADRKLATSRELWQPTRTDPGGDLDRPTAILELERGRLDVAEQLAAASVRRWEGVSHVGRTSSIVVLATIHVRAGERDGLGMAHEAITSVSRLSSVRARRRLHPLADALDTRTGADARDLARTARQVATARV